MKFSIRDGSRSIFFEEIFSDSFSSQSERWNFMLGNVFFSSIASHIKTVLRVSPIMSMEQ